MDNINIINIDGTRGIGKTTQTNLLSVYLKKKGVPILMLTLDGNLDSSMDIAKKTLIFIEKNKDGVVITDGSIARMMVVDLLSGIPSEKVSDKYIPVLREHEKLNHEYSMVNLLIISDNVDMCSLRSIKREKLLGRVSDGIKNKKLELDIVQGLRTFKDNTISRSLDFKVLKVEEDESIMEVHSQILDLITKKSPQ